MDLLYTSPTLFCSISLIVFLLCRFVDNQRSVFDFFLFCCPSFFCEVCFFPARWAVSLLFWTPLKTYLVLSMVKQRRAFSLFLKWRPSKMAGPSSTSSPPFRALEFLSISFLTVTYPESGGTWAVFMFFPFADPIRGTKSFRPLTFFFLHVALGVLSHLQLPLRPDSPSLPHLLLPSCGAPPSLPPVIL